MIVFRELTSNLFQMKEIIHKQGGFCLVLLLFLIIQKPVFAQTPQMVVHKTDGTVLVFSIPGISKLTFDGVSGIDDLSKLTVAVRFLDFLKAYPNPVTTQTSIEYKLVEPGPVRIRIINQQGVLVRELFNRDQPAGTHCIRWNTEDLTGLKVKPGIYLCTVLFKNLTHTERIIVID